MASQTVCQSITGFDLSLDQECFEDVWSSASSTIDSDGCVYKPGGQVKGALRVVVVPCLQPFNFSGIYIDARGEMHFGYSEEAMFENEDKSFTLLPKHQLFGGGPGQLQCLPPGEHQFPFKFDIPSNIPSSYAGSLGSVRYWIDAYIEQSSSGVNLTGHRDIIIHGFYDLTTEPKALIPVEKSEEKISGCECCPGLVLCQSGTFGYALTLPKRGYSHGEKILPAIVLQNQTTSVAQALLRLVKDEVYNNIGGERESWLDNRVELAAFVQDVPAHSTYEWYTELLIGDQFIPSKLTLCPKLKIRYLLEPVRVTSLIGSFSLTSLPVYSLWGHFKLEGKQSGMVTVQQMIKPFCNITVEVNDHTFLKLRYRSTGSCESEISLDLDLFVGHMPENFITLPACGPQTYVHPSVDLSTPQSSRAERQPLLLPPYVKGGNPIQPLAAPSAPPVIHQPFPLPPPLYGEDRPAPPSYAETFAAEDVAGAPSPSYTVPLPDIAAQNEKNKELS